MSRFLVLDNDAGLDDAWEIFLLDKLCPDAQLLALTCVYGNTDIDNVCANNLRVLAELGKPHVPVFKGASSALVPITERHLQSEDLKYFFGRNGFGDVPLPPIDLPKLQEENAVVALHRLSKEYKGKLTLVCSGPLTNIALAVRTYSDFAENVKEIFIMGGNYTAMGNTTMCAEFNFFKDPESAEIVLRCLGGKITLVPWETCLHSQVPFEWRTTSLTKNCGPITELLAKLELPILERLKRLGYTGYITADTILGAIVAKPELVTEEFDAHGTVELGGLHTRGQLVIDHLRANESNVKIIKSINVEEFKKLLISLNIH